MAATYRCQNCRIIIQLIEISPSKKKATYCPYCGKLYFGTKECHSLLIGVLRHFFISYLTSIFFSFYCLLALFLLDYSQHGIIITAGEANIEVLRELYPTRSIECYIKKPVTIDQLVRRVKAELE